MITVGDLLAVLRLRDEMSPALDNAVRNTEALTKSIKATSYELTWFGRGIKETGVLLTGALTIPIVGAGAAAIKFGGDFEEVTTRLVTLANVSEEELEGVKQKILELAPATGVGPVQLAEAMYNVSSTVSDTKTALEILEIAAKGSAMGMGEANVVAKSLTAVINAYGPSNLTAAHAADVLTRAIREGGAEAKDLAPLLGNVAPYAAKMGVSLEQVGANFATITKLGVPASEAITQLNSVFAALTRETPRGTRALEQMGWSYRQIKEEIREKGLAAALVHLKEIFKDNESGLFAVTGRLEALKNIMGTTGEMTQVYLDIVKNMNNVTGEFETAQQRAAQTFQRSWNEIKAALQVAAIELFNGLRPVLMDVMGIIKDLVIPALLGLAKGFSALPEPVRGFIIVLAGIAAVAGPFLIVAGQIVMAIGNLSRAFGFLAVGNGAAGITALRTFLLGAAGWIWPVVAALGPLAAAIGAIWIAWKIGNTESVKNALAEWYMSSESLLASLMRYSDGVQRMTKEQAHAAVSGHAAAVATAAQTKEQEKNTQAVTQTLQTLKTIVPLTRTHTESTLANMHAATGAAAAHLTLAQKVANLTQEQRGQILQLKGLGYGLADISKEMDGLSTRVIGAFIRQVNAQNQSVNAATRALKPMAEAVKELEELESSWKETVASIDPVIVDSVKRYYAMGASMETLATRYELTHSQVKAIIKEWQEEQKTLKENEAATQKWIEAQQELDAIGETSAETIDFLDKEMIDLIKSQIAAGASQSTLMTYYGLTATQVKALIALVREEKKAQDEATEANKRAAEAWEELNAAGINWESEITALDPLTLGAIQHFLNLGYSLSVVAAAFKLPIPMIKAIKDELKDLDRYGNALKVLSSEFTKLGQILGGNMGGIFRGLGQLVVQLESAHKWSKQLGTDGKELGGSLGPLSVLFDSNATGAQKLAAGIATAGAVAAGAIAIWDATASSATAAGNAFAGMMAGAQAGAAFGPWGMAVGAAAGLVVGIIRGKPAWAKAADEVARDFGVKISKELAKTIAETAKTEFGGDRVAGTIYHLADIIKEAGGLTAENLDKMTAKFRDVFVMVETGMFDTAQAAKVLDENWAQFAEAGTDSFGRLSEGLREIVQLQQRFGIESKEMTAWFKSQATGAIEGFNLVVEGMVGTWWEYVEAINSAEVGSREYKEAQDELQKAIDEGRINLADAAQQLDDLGIIAVASFGAAIASGQTWAEALRAAQPGLIQLQQSYAALGIPIEDAALKALLLQSAILDANPALMAAIGGLAQSMINLDNMGLLNVETFQAMERTGYAMFQKLLQEAEKAGGGARDALLPMQDYLHQAEEQARLLGIPLDANTQQMIDQSKELGIWKEKGKDAFETLIQKMDDLINALVGRLYPTIENTPQAPAPWSNWGPWPEQPDYSDPTRETEQFAEGGIVHSTGLVYAHSGEMVLTKEQQMALGVKGAPVGGGSNEDITALRDELAGLRRDFTFVIPNLIAKATTSAFAKTGR